MAGMSGSDLRSVTYRSLPARGVDQEEALRIAAIAARLNALDGITGLLVFNGAAFCQTIEGAPDAIDDLMGRLRRDQRHHHLQVLSDAPVAERRFRSWDMQLLVVPDQLEEALEFAQARLGSTADVEARERIYRTVSGSFVQAA